MLVEAPVLGAKAEGHSAQIMMFLFITGASTYFPTGGTQAGGLHIPHVSKYILCLSQS